MILKYKVPQQFRKIFAGKKVIYCKILNSTGPYDKRIHLVDMLNCNHKTNVFAEDELKELNLFDRIKILKYRRKK